MRHGYCGKGCVEDIRIIFCRQLCSVDKTEHRDNPAVNLASCGFLVKLGWTSCTSAPDVVASTGFHWAEHGNLTFAVMPMKTIHAMRMAPHTVPLFGSPPLQWNSSCITAVGSDMGKTGRRIMLNSGYRRTPILSCPLTHDTNPRALWMWLTNTLSMETAE